MWNHNRRFNRKLGSAEEDSWSSFKFISGPFTEAFEKGYVLLLDEDNLGQKSVLQYMETALDTGKIELDIPYIYININVKIHPDFILVATQNPKLRDSQIKEINYHKNLFLDL